MGMKSKERGPRRPPKEILTDLSLAALSGVLWFTACSDIDIWPFAWIAMVPLLWVVHDKRPKKAFWYAMLAGTVANFGGYYWISGTLVRFAHMPLLVGWGVTLLVAFWQGLVFGLWGAAIAAVRRRTGMGMTFLAPIVIVAAEMIVPMEFPFYLAITQAWVRPVIQIADLTGPVGISFVLVMVGGGLFDALYAWRKREPLPVRRLAAAAGVLVFTLAYGFLQIARYETKIDKAPKLKIGLIQANLGIRVKGRARFADAQLGLHHQLSLELQRRGAELIVWPEATVPFPLSRDRRFWGKEFFSLACRAGPQVLRTGHGTNRANLDPSTLVHVPMLVGAQSNQWGKGVRVAGHLRPERIYNSAVLIDEAGHVSDLYDKMFLVKFSEQIPFYDFLTRFDSLKKQFRRRRMSNFTPGTTPKALRLGRYRLGPMICFEDILPSQGRKIAAEDPNVFVNITNDAWFGKTAEPYQHLALAVFRTIEHRRAMVRAVNTGTSTFIDATGKITLQTPAVDPPPQPRNLRDPTPGVRRAGLKKVRPGVWRSPAWPKPYILLQAVAMMPATTTVYAAVGWLFGWICFLLSLWLVFIHRRGLGKKLFRFRGSAMPQMDRRGRLQAADPDAGAKPRPKAGDTKGKGSARNAGARKKGGQRHTKRGRSR